MTVSRSWTIRGILTVLAASLVLAPAAEASISTYTTSAGSTDSAGDPVSATATFTTGAASLTVTLQNLLVNQKDVGQALSDLGFTFDTGQTTGTLASSSGLARTVASGGGTFTDGAVIATGWGIDNPVSGGLRLCDLCAGAAGPAHTIIGEPNASNLYAAANGSIAGNGPHNPFLAGIVTFNLAIPGLTAASVVNSVFFSFGTTEGDNVPGVPGSELPRVPEPSTLLLLGSGLGLAAAVGWRRRRR